MHPLFERRISVRDFTDQVVPEEDIRSIVEAATQAPSGKNVQNWRFVVVRNPGVIARMAQVVREENRRLSEAGASAPDTERFSKMMKYHSLFDRAPVVVLIYSSDYASTGLSQHQAMGSPDAVLEAIDRPKPGIQNAAAAMAFLQLAAADLGYGTCWMTGPLYAREAIEALIGFDEPGFFLTCLTPLGVPEKWPSRRPKRRPIEEVLTFID